MVFLSFCSYKELLETLGLKYIDCFLWILLSSFIEFIRRLPIDLYLGKFISFLGAGGWKSWYSLCFPLFCVLFLLLRVGLRFSIDLALFSFDDFLSLGCTKSCMLECILLDLDSMKLLLVLCFLVMVQRVLSVKLIWIFSTSSVPFQ